MLWKFIVQLLKLCNKQQRRHAEDNSSFMKLPRKVFIKFKKIWKFCLRGKECWWNIVAFKHVMIKWTQKVWRSKHSKEETWYKISSTSSFEEVPWSLLLLENWFFLGGGNVDFKMIRQSHVNFQCDWKYKKIKQNKQEMKKNKWNDQVNFLVKPPPLPKPMGWRKLYTKT